MILTRCRWPTCWLARPLHFPYFSTVSKIWDSTLLCWSKFASWWIFLEISLYTTYKQFFAKKTFYSEVSMLNYVWWRHHTKFLQIFTRKCRQLTCRQVVIVFGLNVVFGSKAPPGFAWLIPLPFAVFILVHVEVIKLIQRRWNFIENSLKVWCILWKISRVELLQFRVKYENEQKMHQNINFSEKQEKLQQNL